MEATRPALENISEEYEKDLFDTIPARLQEAIKMKGNLTK